MSTHAAEPGCQIVWLYASLAFQDGLPTDIYHGGEGCGEPVTHRVLVIREALGVRADFAANVCTPHAEMAHHADGFKGSWVRQAVT